MTPSLTKPNVLTVYSDRTLVFSDASNKVRGELDRPLDLSQSGGTSFDLEWLAPHERTKLHVALSDLRWVTNRKPSGSGKCQTLAEAIRSGARGLPLADFIVTASEALVFNRGIDQPDRLMTLRRFVSRLDWRRLQAYSNLAWKNGDDYGVWGDSPTESALTVLLDVPEPNEVGCQPLTYSGTSWRRPRLESFLPEKLRDSEPRLAIAEVVEIATLGIGGGEPPVMAMAKFAQPNLAFVSDPTSTSADSRWCMGVAPTMHEAVIKARAEGAERFTLGDYCLSDLRRASANDLGKQAIVDGVVPKYSVRQRREHHLRDFDPDAPEWWVAGECADGTPVWLPAALVLCPFGEWPDWLLYGYPSSNGAAAHTILSQARLNAWLELNERDAFMRMFLSQRPPARVRPSDVPGACADLIQSLAATDLACEVAVVCLTSSLGVRAYSCLVRSGDRFTVGASCQPDPANAIVKAVTEVVLQLRYPVTTVDIAPADVRTPEDHARFYAIARNTAAIGWMFAGEEAAQETEQEFPGNLIGSAYFYDKESEDGLVVSKCLDPRLIHLTFGHDTLPEDHGPVKVALAGAAPPRLPHPFP